MDFSLPAVTGLVAALWSGTPADVDATPRDLLLTVYAHPVLAPKVLSADEIYSTRLNTLFDTYFSDQRAILAASRDQQAPINLIPFDPLSLVAPNATVAISEPVIRDRQATATVSIETPEGPSQLSLFMIEEPEGWRIDDIASYDADGEPWLLSWILRYDPPMGG